MAVSKEHAKGITDEVEPRAADKVARAIVNIFKSTSSRLSLTSIDRLPPRIFTP
ncbi:MAG: hypothetical protein AAF708_12640 [Deinococcota bacterium]